jgi:ethanolamine utilization protein EutA
MAESTQEGHSHSGAYAGLHSHDGGALHWHDEFGEHTMEELTEEEFAARSLDWKMHNATIVTVGIDIGSSTSHLMFSRIHAQILGEGAEAQSVVVGREMLWQSEIILTPYVDAETIDARAVRGFISDAYRAVGASANEVDTGSIILTGEALKRRNSRPLGEIAAAFTGKFVCATAGHHLEAVLAANGSGTVARSRRDQQTILNVDIGGGTTKFALVSDGQIISTAAVAIGARQLVKDQWDRLTRIDGPVRLVAEKLGIELKLDEQLSPADEGRIVEAWTDILASVVKGESPTGLAAELMLTDPLVLEEKPQAIAFSGGVSEYIFFRETKDFGDLGKPLAKALRAAMAGGKITLPAIVDQNQGIRATAIGASQFSVQVGSNIYVTDEGMLPLANVPVLVPKLDLGYEITDAAEVASAVRAAVARAEIEEGEQPIALVVQWSGEAVEPHINALAQGIREGLARTMDGSVLVVLLTAGNVAPLLGKTLKEDLGVPGGLIAMEGVSVHEFDFIDIAEIVHPTEVVPVTIKSLLFAGGLDRRSIKQALLEAARAQR